jgi:hypothetical protein
VKEQMKFFVAKVDIKKVKMDAAGVATLSPLRVTYESNDTMSVIDGATRTGARLMPRGSQPAAAPSSAASRRTRARRSFCARR